ncbi:glycine--tRNA ligase subunit beta [Extensimonas vulgaris]|uniref:Glycine--tRNA ligase beta subunit n=1 Tax=Extensimonas vulgaris TaxID=1031594 RepID=A0A369ARM1_9BURK|nr:glycine--tRNA ligase subunit beta [Extensimonas vulgaris]RCX10104.1 glycyl-tRNA synthetase beta chain [Extensimonas vulgaris]TWI36499.1 glycyl-tRNA synthetase beta chain [Extensimonas vulgaris]TXD17254.1 glycine--tRNA ligase subunit beta [Extensimonas vulgaris]
MNANANLLVELFVEELPPKALKKLGESFAGVLAEQLRAQGLAAADAKVTAYASPRRLGAHITGVAAKAADQAVRQKLMPVAVGLDAQGNPTPALRKKLQALGVDVGSDAALAAVLARLQRASDGKTEALFLDSVAPGATLAVGLQKALHEAIARLPIPKVMSYQLETDCELPGWSTVHFVRPAHGLVALHGAQVVPVHALGLRAGRHTHGHRFEAQAEPIELAHADAYAEALRTQGAVIAHFGERRAVIESQLNQAAAKAGPALTAIKDDALLDEVTALVERPNVLVCEFEREFLEVPQECLILTMQANQKYFPLLDAAGKLTNRFLVVSNICPQDASAVIGGNERVVRPRLADAKFFFDQDRKKPLASRVPQLAKVVYHNRLGTQLERVQRVRAIARAIVQQLAAAAEAEAAGAWRALALQADQAAELAKADLLTDMVGEFPELQGTMGRYYALHDGLPAEVADAIEDHYKPRFAGDSLPRGPVGVVVALADKLETLVGMFGIGNLPTGERDPFALRRHALGVIRMLIDKALPLELDALLGAAVPAFGSLIEDPRVPLADFIYERLAGLLREQGYAARAVEAVLALRPQRLADVPKRLQAVRAFATLPEAEALAAANKRIANILKKAGDAEEVVDPHVSELLLQEPAEKALYAAMLHTVPRADAQFAAGDYTGSLRTLAALRTPVDAFFDDVMVNAEQLDVRLNRLGLLKALHLAMNRVADLSRLAV